MSKHKVANGSGVLIVRITSRPGCLNDGSKKNSGLVLVLPQRLLYDRAIQ